MITNIKNKVFLALVLSSCTGSIIPGLSPVVIAESYTEASDSAFRYLELLFIERPRNELKAAAAQAQAVMLSLIGATIIGNSLFNKPADAKVESAGDKKDSKDSNKFAPFTIATALASGSLVKVAYDLYMNYLNQSIKKSTLVSFLTNWNFHRQHIPSQLVPAFDELAKFYATNKTVNNDQVNQIFEIIQHLIEHEFAKRYEKDKMKEADTIATIKTLTDITKNCGF